MILPLLLASTVAAQTQLVRGDIDTIQGTNQFRLDCTGILLVSNTVNLQQLHDQSRQADIEYEMQCIDVSAGGPTTLNVVSATVIPELLDMGNLRLSRADRWTVMGTPGAAFGVWITAESLTSYLPAGALGTWVLGFTILPLQTGTIGALGQTQWSFQPPNIPGLIGTSFTAQAITQDPATGYAITNPHCKTVQS